MSIRSVKNMTWIVCGVNKTCQAMRANKVLLREEYPSRIICHLGDVNWPAESIFDADKLSDLERLNTLFKVRLRFRLICAKRCSNITSNGWKFTKNSQAGHLNNVVFPI